jgi:Flp pilus assembly pilin Flp
MSKRFSLNSQEVTSILKVALWTIASTVLAALVSVVATIEFPVEYAFIPVVLNVLLVAAVKFVEGKK